MEWELDYFDETRGLPAQREAEDIVRSCATVEAIVQAWLRQGENLTFFTGVDPVSDEDVVVVELRKGEVSLLQVVLNQAYLKSHYPALPRVADAFQGSKPISDGKTDHAYQGWFEKHELFRTVYFNPFSEEQYGLDQAITVGLSFTASAQGDFSFYVLDGEELSEYLDGVAKEDIPEGRIVKLGGIYTNPVSGRGCGTGGFTMVSALAS